MKRVAIAAAVLFALGAEPMKESGDYKALQGKWDLIEIWQRGERSDPPYEAGLIFNGKEVTALPQVNPQKPLKSTFSLSTQGRVKRIERSTKVPPDTINTTRGVYELSGDTLKLHYSPDTTTFPKKMPDKTAEGITLVFKRAAAKK